MSYSMSKNVLVTGSGGIGGVNFVNALRVAKREYTISGLSLIHI